jgi:hypothetical protein
MRPVSHRTQDPEHGCFDCKHSAKPEYKDHLLCFFGDDVIINKSQYITSVEFNGNDVSLMDGDEYDEVWGGRVVTPTDTCDEWEQG